MPQWLLRGLCWIKTGPGIGVEVVGNKAVLLSFMTTNPKTHSRSVRTALSSPHMGKSSLGPSQLSWKKLKSCSVYMRPD